MDIKLSANESFAFLKKDKRILFIWNLLREAAWEW